MKKEEKVLEVAEEKTEEEIQYEKRAPAITSFVFAALSYATMFGLLSFIFSIIALVYSNKAKGVKTTCHKVFVNISKPVSIILLILNIIVPIVVFVIVCTVAFLYLVAVIIAFIAGL